MSETIIGEIKCPCGYYEEVEYNLSVGPNTIEWTCPKCGAVTTMNRMIEKTEEKKRGNFPRIGSIKRHKSKMD